MHVPLTEADAPPEDSPHASPLATVAWSPPGTQRTLLTVTRSGIAFIWRQQPSVMGSPGSGMPIAVSEWFGEHAFTLTALPGKYTQAGHGQEPFQTQRLHTL